MRWRVCKKIKLPKGEDGREGPKGDSCIITQFSDGDCDDFCKTICFRCGESQEYCTNIRNGKDCKIIENVEFHTATIICGDNTITFSTLAKPYRLDARINATDNTTIVELKHGNHVVDSFDLLYSTQCQFVNFIHADENIYNYFNASEICGNHNNFVSLTCINRLVNGIVVFGTPSYGFDSVTNSIFISCIYSDPDFAPILITQWVCCLVPILEV